MTADSFEAEASSQGCESTRLVFVATAEDPRCGSSSHALDDVDEVRFRRGARAVERGRRVLTLSFPDPRMSSLHGSLHAQGGRWILDDATSKNGSIVDGGVARRSVLVDGSLLELGHSFFVFRKSTLAREPPPHLARDVDAEHLPRWPSGMATFSPALAREYDDLLRLAPSAVSIVVTGETGTGKELAARAIHARSNRSGSFVAINCGAVAPTLVESELFGHRRGAFSGASTDRRGLVRAADKGTLFLDEIGELPFAAQASLLRVLQEREVLPLGDDHPIAVDLRVVAATLRDLDRAIASGGFRADLYARLAAHVVCLPPLRQRREDFGLLLAALLPRTADLRFTPTAVRTLLRYEWPHNIRELEQCLSTASALARDGLVDRTHLPAAVRSRRSVSTEPPEIVLEPDDRELRARLLAMLGEHEGNVTAVAAALGKERQQVYKWLKRLAIEVSAFRRRT
jgi:transcriptional regulator with GAF, ATPase, and Fis domain